MAIAENPWIQLPVREPFVLEQDCAAIRVFNKTASEKTGIDLSIPPEPFLGPYDAKLLVLLLNPGTGELTRTRKALVGAITAPETCRVHPWIAASAKSNLGDSEDGARWWLKLVKSLAPDGNLERIGANIMSVEFFPYRSVSFGAAHVRLPSQEYSFQLVRRAMHRDAAIVLARGRRCWFGAIPELESYPLRFDLKNPRSASLSKNNLVPSTPGAWTKLQLLLADPPQ